MTKNILLKCAKSVPDGLPEFTDSELAKLNLLSKGSRYHARCLKLVESTVLNSRYFPADAVTKDQRAWLWRIKKDLTR